MSGIIPKREAKGTDFCGAGGNIYIIRSDLGCYMKTSDLNNGSDISIFSLHPACQNGDHYIGDWAGYFYIIKGNNYRRVKNLTTDSDAEVHSLHPNCQGGDHYLSANVQFFPLGKFYIIFQEKGTYRATTNMNTDSDAEEHNLHPDCRNGLYYWSMTIPQMIMSLLSFLKPVSEWGVEFCSSTDLSKDKFFGVYSVHPDVLNFLPGGLSVTKGPSFGTWENIKTISNDSDTPVTWTKKINKKVGWNKEKMTQITHNWKISASVSIGTGALAKLITNLQFSFSAEYGGSHVSTENESSNEMTEEEEQLSFELKPKESVYLWQYRMGLGEEPVLFCRDLKITNDPNPPTEVPLPPAQS
ncbi:uncharacterized protein LOC125269465 [Megalobrama amblycephala]|uniref:uncharacterized protein LOC125269465 n=1 Tax=Megalobrama amblycephala TaxID=75352 RepID=UPI00201446A8|nr:uncharacterized protein LOC125269465 [Megalobrama amblycephala]